MIDTKIVGSQLTFHHASHKELLPGKYKSGEFVRVFLDGKSLGVFSRSIVNPLRKLLRIGNDDVWLALSDETRYLIHAEDMGEYVLLWLHDFVAKKYTRREVILIKA